ncbi:hypothetical protein BSK54_21815 [Paenibacillus odorifer]|nr:hypothetical protein BSK54_21815 [Paenibacillus odorifer]
MGEHRQRYNEEFKNRQCSSFKSKQRQWATWRKSLTSQKVPCINGVYVAVYSVYVSHVGEYPPVEPYIPPFQLLQLLSTGFIPYILPFQLPQLFSTGFIPHIPPFQPPQLFSTGFIPYILPFQPLQLLSTGFIPYILPSQPLQLFSTGFIPYILPFQLFMQNNYEVRSQLQFSLPYIINSAS